MRSTGFLFKVEESLGKLHPLEQQAQHLGQYQIRLLLVIAVRGPAKLNQQVDKLQKREHPAHVLETRLLPRHQNNVYCCLFIYLNLAFNATKKYLVSNSLGHESGTYVVVS